MKDRVPAFRQANAGLGRRGLHIGQTVEVKRGVLAGLSGVLIGFRHDNCMVELDVVECGVALIIDIKNVKERCNSASDEVKSMRAKASAGAWSNIFQNFWRL